MTFKMHMVVQLLILTGLCLFSFADAIVDKDFDDNQNDFEYYWYYYDDLSTVAKGERSLAPQFTTPSVINGEYVEFPRHAFGDENDSLTIREYTFQTTESLGLKCATMPFTLGDPWEAYYCDEGQACAMPYVGMVTMLCKDGSSFQARESLGLKNANILFKKGSSIDLTGVDGFRFLIKSRVDSLNVRFQVRTLDVEEYANKPRQDHEGDEYGFHSYDFTVIPGVWQEVVVPVEDLELPGSWAADFEFDITRCTKLAWELFDTDGLQIDTLDVADVSLYSDYHTAHWNRTPVFNEEYSLPPVSGSVFASFDCGPVNMSPLGTWWSGFNDTEYGGTSHVDENFAYFDSTTGLLNIEFQYGTGSDGQGIGAVYEYELGPTLTENANVLGHIGIFVDLYDSSKARYFNADEENVHSVYFEYQTTGARYLTFELYDSCDVGDSNTPERFYSRGFKRVFHRHLPATGGSWRKVQIPFDALLLSRRPGVSPYWPLATTHLAKMRWVVYGEEGSEGYMAIDNIFLRDGAFGGTEECHSSVQLSRKHDSRNAGLHITSRGNSIRLSVSDQLKIKNGRIRIFNSHGVTLQNCEISGVNRLPIQFSTKGYSTGLYFIQVDGIGKEGGSFSFTEKVSIVK